MKTSTKSASKSVVKAAKPTVLQSAREAGAVHGTHHGYMVGEVTKVVVGKAAQTTGRGLLYAGQYLASFGKNTVKGFARTSV